MEANKRSSDLLLIKWLTKQSFFFLTLKALNTLYRYKSDSYGYMDRVKRIWYLSPMRAAKVQASLRIRQVSVEPSVLAHTSSESRGIFRQKARSLAPLNGWACTVKICHEGMLEDTNSLDTAHIFYFLFINVKWLYIFNQISQECFKLQHSQKTNLEKFQFGTQSSINKLIREWISHKYWLSLYFLFREN